LGILADEAGDKLLLSDLVAAEGCCGFQSILPLEDGDHFQLLLSIVTGVSDHQLCRNFLLDRSAIATIRHNFQSRYSSTFFWLDKFFKETAAKGFASAGSAGPILPHMPVLNTLFHSCSCTNCQ